MIGKTVHRKQTDNRQLTTDKLQLSHFQFTNLNTTFASLQNHDTN
jgi:hypothetical protein